MVGYPKDDRNEKFEAEFVLNKKEKEGSKSSVLSKIRPAIQTAGIENLGIICDADNQSVESAWQSISDRLKLAGYQNLPANHGINGTIIEPQGNLPKIGVWVFPNNEDEGAVETFFQSLFSENEPLLNHAKTTIDSLPVKHFPEKDSQKAIVNTWLAWQAEPGRTMGIALRENWIEANGDLADRFINWFEQVFELEKSA